MNAAEAMRRDWNMRARRDAFYYIASWRKGWDTQEFFAARQDNAGIGLWRRTHDAKLRIALPSCLWLRHIFGNDRSREEVIAGSGERNVYPGEWG